MTKAQRLSLEPLCAEFKGPSLENDFALTNDDERLLLLCEQTGHEVEDTYFPHKDIHKWTWYSLDSSTKKAVDHILVSQYWRSLVTNCWVYKGAELGNAGHRLLAATFKIKLKATSPKKQSDHLGDTGKLKDLQINTVYTCTVANHLNALSEDRMVNHEVLKGAIQEAKKVAISSTNQKPWKLDNWMNTWCHRTMLSHQTARQWWWIQVPQLSMKLVYPWGQRMILGRRSCQTERGC